MFALQTVRSRNEQKLIPNFARRHGAISDCATGGSPKRFRRSIRGHFRKSLLAILRKVLCRYTKAATYSRSGQNRELPRTIRVERRHHVQPLLRVGKKIQERLCAVIASNDHGKEPLQILRR